MNRILSIEVAKLAKYAGKQFINLYEEYLL